jgi:hypothetical protein
MMLLEAIQHRIRYRLRDGQEIQLCPGLPMEVPDAKARKLLQKLPKEVRAIEPMAECPAPVETDAPFAPLLPGWLVVYRGACGRLRGGDDERGAGTVKACIWDGQTWQVTVANGDVIPMTRITGVTKTDGAGRILAAWTVKDHRYDGEGRKP